jgi:hypothetical protein
VTTPGLGAAVKFGTHGEGVIIADTDPRIPRPHRSRPTHPGDFVYVLYTGRHHEFLRNQGDPNAAIGGWFTRDTLRPVTS